MRENSDTQFMHEALEEAVKASAKREVPVGALLVNDGRVIARAHNETIFLNDPTAHAEILVLRRGAKQLGNYRLTNTSLYVTIEPCLMCSGAMIHARIKNLIYGSDDPRAGAVSSIYQITNDKRLNHQIHVTKGIW